MHLDGYLLTPHGFLMGRLSWEAGRIAVVQGDPIDTAAVRDDRRPIVLPGFVDSHVHGAAGRDVMDAGDAVATIARLHAVHGTTTLLATTMTAPMEDLTAAFSGLGAYCRDRPTDGARLAGVHLEGPYINPGKLGAQPDYARPLDLAELAALNTVAPIRLITLAPEVGRNREAIRELVAAGYRVQIGHTLASYEEGSAALASGASGFTHLFNAMSGMHHREPGVVGAALAHAEFAEIIPDLLHVHPGAIRAALRSIPRLFCVTDSTSATGMPDGEYRLGRNHVIKCLGGVRLADGTLAGSTLTMDQALRNLVDTLGIDLADAARRVATYAADYLGLTDCGRLEAGMRADMVVLNRDLVLQDVFIEGRRVAR